METDDELLIFQYYASKRCQRHFKRRQRRFWVHASILCRTELRELVQEWREDENRFKMYFRMPTDTFDYLLSLLEATIQRSNTNFRLSISPVLTLCLDIQYCNEYS